VLVKRGHVLLVAREAVQRLGDHHLERAGARALEQLLVPGTEPACAAQAMVGIGGSPLPAFSNYPSQAGTHLVLDRSLSLQVRAVAGEDGGARVRHGERGARPNGVT
jgi:hypothetical protein